MQEMGGVGKGLRTGVNAILRSGDVLAPAAWAAARSGGRFQDEASLSTPRDGFYDMREMIFHLPLRNAEELRKLVGGEPGPRQESDYPLAHGL